MNEGNLNGEGAVLARKGLADPHCPRGHRLLYQCLAARSESEGREELRRIFGRAKGSAAVLVPGTRRPHPGATWKDRKVPWEWWEKGFRAYLPLSFEDDVAAWARRHRLA